MLAQQQPWLSVVAFVFLFANLGSVCAHCLYNSAVGWSRIGGGHMRVFAVGSRSSVSLSPLPMSGRCFIPWLSLLGILVPPIGAIVLADMYFVRPGAVIDADWRPRALHRLGRRLTGGLAVENLRAAILDRDQRRSLPASSCYLVLQCIGTAKQFTEPCSPVQPRPSRSAREPSRALTRRRGIETMDYEIFDLGNVPLLGGATLREREAGLQDLRQAEHRQEQRDRLPDLVFGAASTTTSG